MVTLSLGLILGGILTILGVVFCVYWYVYFKKNFQGKVLTEGPYDVVRHPFYTGFIMFALGLVFALPSYETRILLVITLAVMYVYVPKEEEQMLKENKNEYREYMEKVKWRLIPYIY